MEDFEQSQEKCGHEGTEGQNYCCGLELLDLSIFKCEG